MYCIVVAPPDRTKYARISKLLKENNISWSEYKQSPLTLLLRSSGYRNSFFTKNPTQRDTFTWFGQTKTFSELLNNPTLHKYLENEHPNWFTEPPAKQPRLDTPSTSHEKTIGYEESPQKGDEAPGTSKQQLPGTSQQKVQGVKRPLVSDISEHSADSEFTGTPVKQSTGITAVGTSQVTTSTGPRINEGGTLQGEAGNRQIQKAAGKYFGTIKVCLDNIKPL